ncbi:BofC C-terminal domain-containing protein [Paenibacillus sp. GP183]|uniref:BofC C-terminal domain-containing protein n=1 Tax=Paenibacillus sp. GP183 TaxID=1882751 RepID=UPI000897DF39|nr:BofC C-terminal domain-containing protein [Paenibacillus sp. GP183]SEC72900.1 forespore regulator of the sigma-K checkpoint [Paenibacillus sp. GP183]
MNVYKFLKNLKKKLRWRRKWIALGLFLVAIAAGLTAFSSYGSYQNWAKSKSDLRTRSVLAPSSDSEAIRSFKGKQDVYLQTLYVCGEETERLGTWSSYELQEQYKKHPEWLIRMNEPDKVTFIKHVEDLSPSCKAQAYMGLDENGSLSLFNGMPAVDNVIRTFFQLDIRYLESSLPKETLKQLQDGIRITDMAEYNSVLSTFSDYAMGE